MAHHDRRRSTSSPPTTFLTSLTIRSPPSPLGKVDAPLERGVSGRAGSPRPTGEGQRCALRCLFVPGCEGLRTAVVVTNKSSTTVDTRLADRTAQLATPVDSGATGSRRSSVAPNEFQQTVSSMPGTVPKRQPSFEPAPSLTELLKATRADLSEAQRSRTELQDRLNQLNIELEKLRKKSHRDGRRLGTLESEKDILGKRLKDRDEELRAKTKLLEVGGFVSRENQGLLLSGSRLT